MKVLHGRVRIADLKDGSNLNSSCTGCHRGYDLAIVQWSVGAWQVFTITQTPMRSL